MKSTYARRNTMLGSATAEERAEAIRQSDAKFDAYQADKSDANFRALTEVPEGVKLFCDAGKREAVSARVANGTPKYRLYEAQTKNQKTGRMTPSGAVIGMELREDGTANLENIFSVGRGATTAKRISEGGWIYTPACSATALTRVQFAAEIEVLEAALRGHQGSEITAPNFDPFAVAVEASRINPARRVFYDPVTIEAFEALRGSPVRGQQAAVGGFEAVR